jgi:hypothetical protein
MLEVRGNLWTYPADVRVITTNGTVKKNGECVMGRGCAKEARDRFPSIAHTLGDGIRRLGNIVQLLHRYDDGLEKWDIVSFPVKHEWFQRADIELIRVSATTLSHYATLHGWQRCVMPRPGCGNGNLQWKDVRPVLEPILDDRFHLITF